jgi:hypothetical protein
MRLLCGKERFFCSLPAENYCFVWKSVCIMFVLLSSRFCCFLYFRKGEEEFSEGRLSSPLLFCTPEKRRKQTERRKKGRGMVHDGSCNPKNEQSRWIILYWTPAVLGFLPEAESKEKHGVWDPMPELTITSPYVHSRVDSNTFIGQPYICQSRLYPPSRGLWIWPRGFLLCRPSEPLQS